MDNELFEKAPIPEAYFSLAMPVVLSMLVTLVYNMVDTYSPTASDSARSASMPPSPPAC